MYDSCSLLPHVSRGCMCAQSPRNGNQNHQFLVSCLCAPGVLARLDLEVSFSCLEASYTDILCTSLPWLSCLLWDKTQLLSRLDLCDCDAFVNIGFVIGGRNFTRKGSGFWASLRGDFIHSLTCTRHLARVIQLQMQVFYVVSFQGKRRSFIFTKFCAQNFIKRIITQQVITRATWK